MRGALPAAVLSLLATTAPATAQERGLTPMDVMKLRSVTGVYPHPSQSHVAFTRTEPRPAGEVGSARNHLWFLEQPRTAGEDRKEHLLVGGKKSVHGIAWHPTGEALTFIQKEEGDEHPEIYLIRLDGEIEKMTDTPHGVSSYQWRPDGTALAYTVTDPRSESDEKAHELGFHQRVVDEDFRQVSLWLWDLKTRESRQLTVDMTVFSFEWSPNSKHLVAGTAPSSLVDDSYMFTRLTLVDPNTGATEMLVDNPGKLGDYEWSPDSKQLAYVSAVDRNDPHAGMLFTIDMDKRVPQAISPDFRGMVHGLIWYGPAEDSTLMASASLGVRSAILEIDVEGRTTKTVQELLVAFKSLARGNYEGATPQHRLFVLGSTAAHPNEICEVNGGNTMRLTNSNPWLDDIALGKQEVERFTARDGLEIEGILIYPIDHEEHLDYPMVIVAHGGPESHYSDGWNTSYSAWGQMLAARGYFAWYPNYRSSTGYGVEFAVKDHGDPMGKEFEDHIDAIAHFERLIDTTRVGIGGGSYGGYTAAWAATRQTEHFAAAVSFVPFVDIRTKWYTSDIPWEFYYVHYQEKWPHQQMKLLAERSPLTWAPLCRTPLLLLGGTSDPRVHPSQPFMLYRAVKTATTTPVRYVQYPGEGHGNRSNVYQYDYAERTLRWFDHYLKNINRRAEEPPPFEVDYGEWAAAAARQVDEGEIR